MSIGRVRPAVTGLPAYRPGKAAEQAEEEHGIADAIKLASNENPYEPIAPVVEAMQAAARGSIEGGRLLGRAPRSHHACTREIVAGCGRVLG